MYINEISKPICQRNFINREQTHNHHDDAVPQHDSGPIDFFRATNSVIMNNKY